ncbi:MAG: hypothetical protein JJU28_24640 [Cyclobacteriaceae bacterium]|nr:hypothetical protein [Cyclobacteriaceae bacterium]
MCFITIIYNHNIDFALQRANHNVIGPGNVGNNNELVGIVLLSFSDFNTIFENTFLGNGFRDMSNFGIGNTFTDNITSGNNFGI